MRVRFALGALIFVALAVVALAIRDGLAAKDHLQIARASLLRVQSGLDRPLPAVRADLDAAGVALRAARTRVDGLAIRAFALIPYAGRSARSARALTAAASDAIAAGRLAVDAARPFEGADGTLDLDLTSGAIDASKWEALTEALRRAAEASVASFELADASPGTLLLPQLREARAEVVNATGRLSQALLSATAASQVVPRMLGAYKDRRYLLVLQNSSEARATGGLIGGFALLSSSKGRLTLGAVAPNYELRRPSSPVPMPAWYRDRYDRFAAREHWSNVNAEADFRVTGALTAALFEKTSGLRIDGVIALDPMAMAAFLKVTGPLDGPRGIRLEAESFPRVAMHDAYQIFGKDGGGERKLWFAESMRLIFDRVLRTGGGVGMARAFGEAASGKHLQAWARDAQEQALFETLRSAGRFDGGGAPFVGVAVQNAAANKADFFLRRSFDFDVRLNADRSADITMTAVLTNDIPAPEQELHQYVPGPPVPDVGPGGNKTFFSVYISPNAFPETMEEDGRAIAFESALAPHAIILSKYFTIAPGGSKKVVLHWRQPAFVQPGSSPAVRFTVRGQPLFIPAEVAVRLTDDGPWRAPSFAWRTRTNADFVVTTSLSRPLLSRVFG